MEDEMILIFFLIMYAGHTENSGKRLILKAKMFGKEELPVYSMEIWVPVE
jgi:hypothetical protein